MEIRGPKFSGAADRETPGRCSDQHISELEILAAPRIVKIQPCSQNLRPGKRAFFAENVLGKHTERAAERSRQPGNRNLSRTGAANQVVVYDLALPQDAYLVFQK